MTRRSHQRMLDRGRKAGLNADELYRALSSYKPALGDDPAKTDGNGYVAHVKDNGQRDYQPPTEK